MRKTSVGAGTLVLLGACACGSNAGLDAHLDPDAHVELDAHVALDAPPESDATTVDDDARVPMDSAAHDAASTDVFAVADTSVDATSMGCHLATTAPRLDPTAVDLPIDGLVLWLRADVGVRLDGSSMEVCGWENQVGSEVFTPDGAGRPQYLPSWRGGLPGIRADSGDWLVASGVLGMSPTGGRSFFGVTEVLDADIQAVVIYQGQRGSRGLYVGIEHNVGTTAGRLFGIHMPTDVSLDSTFPTTVGNVSVHSLVVDGLTVGSDHTSVAHYFNDGRPSVLSLRLGAATVSDFSAADATWVAWGLGSFVESEVLAYSRPLSDTDRQRVERYLTTRHATTP